MYIWPVGGNLEFMEKTNITYYILTNFIPYGNGKK
jgi:hypothetical protein